MFVRGITVALLSGIIAPLCFAETTSIRSFKVYEEFPIVTVDKKTVVLGKGQVSARPQPRPTTDWRAYGKIFGMKANEQFCSSQEYDDMVKRFSQESFIGELYTRLKAEFRSELTDAEEKSLAALALCPSHAEALLRLAQVVPNFDEPKPNTTTKPADSNMIVNALYSDEGHGWLVVNSRLTGGQQAIIHTGNKIGTGFVTGSEDVLVTSQITKQPFALRKTRLHSAVKIFDSSTRQKSCDATEYTVDCYYDHETGTRKCERVPYTVPGWQDVTTRTIELTYINELQILSADQSRILGSLVLDTSSGQYTDTSEGWCESTLSK